MEEDIDLDDDYDIKKDLNEEKQKQFKKIFIKIINRIHNKPYLLRRAMVFKDWKIKSGIKSSEEVDKPKNIKKSTKKIKKKKIVGTEKKDEEKNLKEDLDNSKNKTENKNNNNDNKDKVDDNNNMHNEEKTGEKIKKVKKIVKKKIIKKKLTKPDDDLDKISNQTTLTTPNLVVNLLNEEFNKIDNEDKEIQFEIEKNLETQSNFTLDNNTPIKKVIKKKKIIKNKVKKSEENNNTENNNKEIGHESEKNKIKKIVKKKIKKKKSEILILPDKKEEQEKIVNLTEPNINPNINISNNISKEEIKNNETKKEKIVKSCKEEKEAEKPEENKIQQQNQENIINNDINIIPPKVKELKVKLDEENISKSSNMQYKLDLDLQNNDSKVQFAEGVSEKKLDFDFYHNKGKDSYLDLRALKNLEKIEFSDNSDEDEKAKKIKKKKKKKLKKEKKEGEEFDGDKSSKKRKYTEEEKNKAKIYKKGMHLLRKAIRSYKKRNNKNEYENRFQFWKNIVTNSKLTKPEENYIEAIPNKIDEKNSIEVKDDIIKDSEKKVLNKEVNQKDNNLLSIQNLIEINNKINNEVISLLKKTDEERFNEFKPEIFNKILYENNKKILAYKLFCIYNNYNNSLSFRKKVYLNKWNKMK